MVQKSYWNRIFYMLRLYTSRRRVKRQPRIIFLLRNGSFFGFDSASSIKELKAE